MFNHKAGALVIVLLLVGVLGCQPAATAVPPAPTAAAGIEPPPVEAPSSLVVVIPEDPPSFNAVVADSGYDALVMHLTMLGMAEIDPAGQVYPVLAAELPTVENGGVVIDEDAWTMDVSWRMRQDVTWADGEPVTADDVLFTYEAIINPETGAWIPGIDLVTGVDKVDDYSFVVHYSSVYPSHLTLFGGRQVVIWPAHYCDASQGFQNWDCGRQPLSNGPFTLKEWMTGDHLTLEKNPAYYEPGKPAIDSIIIKIVPDATVRETMLRQGDADILMWATEQVAYNLKDAAGVKVSISPTGRWVMRMFINLAVKGSTDPVADPNPLFSDVRVRQAMRAAIDVDRIADSVWYGFAKPVWTEFFRPPYDTCNIPRPAFDPEAARALLDEAGWVEGADGIRECQGCGTAPDGTRFQFELLTYSEYGEPLSLTQQLIAEMLKDVGIQADLSQVQGTVLWADSSSGGLEQTGNFEIDLYDDGYAGNDPTDFIWQYYYSESAEPDYGWNVGRWTYPGFDDLVDAAYTLDEAERTSAFCEMATILDTELPQILLFSTVNADAYSTRVQNVEANVNSVVSWNAADWTLTK